MIMVITVVVFAWWMRRLAHTWWTVPCFVSAGGQAIGITSGLTVIPMSFTSLLSRWSGIGWRRLFMIMTWRWRSWLYCAVVTMPMVIMRNTCW
jgi:hypothetical protein